jgi:hypothetical protein
MKNQGFSKKAQHDVLQHHQQNMDSKTVSFFANPEEPSTLYAHPEPSTPYAL